MAYVAVSSIASGWQSVAGCVPCNCSVRPPTRDATTRRPDPRAAAATPPWVAAVSDSTRAPAQPNSRPTSSSGPPSGSRPRHLAVPAAPPTPGSQVRRRPGETPALWRQRRTRFVPGLAGIRRDRVGRASLRKSERCVPRLPRTQTPRSDQGRAGSTRQAHATSDDAGPRRPGVAAASMPFASRIGAPPVGHPPSPER